MPFRLLLVLAIGGGLAWHVLQVAPEHRAPSDLSGIGVSLAGAEFGVARGLSNQMPGVHDQDYHYSGDDTVHAVAMAKLRFIRLPFRWERIQPTLGGPLNPIEIGRIQAVVDYAEQRGVAVLLDLHNYGRYRIATDAGVIEAVIDHDNGKGVLVSREHLADVWRRLARRFADSSSVAGYGLMNEPHDLGDSDWHAISQATVNAIRQVDRSTRIVVAGEGWSSAARFTEFNGPTAWINDPANNTAYEAHAYYDRNASGKYAISYREEIYRDPSLPERGVTRVADFLDWLERNEVPGLLGEVGIPTDEPEWRSLLAATVKEASHHGVPVCLWAAGEWWGDYRLSLQLELLGARPPVTLRAAVEASAKEAH